MEYFSSYQIGGIVTSASFLIDYFFNNFELLFLTYGVGVGFGTGLISLAITAILPHYFIKRLSLATGISQTGTAIGMFIFSGLNELLVSEYSVQGAFLILSAISLNAIPLGLLMREPTIIQDEDNERELLLDKKIQSESECSDDPYKGNKSNSTVKGLGLDLLRNGHFAVLMVANFLIIISHYIIPIMLPEHIVLLGGSQQQGANMVVIIGGANIFSRLLLGNVKTETTKSMIAIVAVSSIISGGSLGISVFYTSYWMYACLCITFGLTRGIYIIYATLLTVRIVGKENSHHAFGVTFSVWGLAIVIGLPSCGVLAHVTWVEFQYRIVFMCVGIGEILAGVLFIMMYINAGNESTV